MPLVWILERLGVGSADIVMPTEHAIRLNVASEVSLAQTIHALTIPYDSLKGNEEMREFALGWIRNALVNGTRVVVTCGAGINRSVTVVIWYLQSIGMGKDEALALMKQRHPVSGPLLDDIK